MNVHIETFFDVFVFVSSRFNVVVKVPVKSRRSNTQIYKFRLDALSKSQQTNNLRRQFL